MALGYRNKTQVAGLVAAGMSVFGVVAAKVAIFVFVVYAVVTGDTSSIELQRAFVTSSMGDDILDDRGILSEAERNEQWDSVWDESDRQVSGMSDEEVRRRWKEYRELQESEALADAGAGDDDAVAADESPPVGEEPELGDAKDEADFGPLLGVFFAASFGWMDVLFILLALGSAYKIASGSGGE